MSGSLSLRGGVMRVSRPPSPLARDSTRRNGEDEEQINIYSLPTAMEAEEKMNRFFSNSGLLFPYVHEETFRKTYTEMRQNSFIKIRRSWLGLFNMVLAIATTVSGDWSTERRLEISDVYYQRAVGLCDKQIRQGTVNLENGESFSADKLSF